MDINEKIHAKKVEEAFVDDIVIRDVFAAESGAISFFDGLANLLATGSITAAEADTLLDDYRDDASDWFRETRAQVILTAAASRSGQVSEGIADKIITLGSDDFAVSDVVEKWDEILKSHAK